MALSDVVAKAWDGNHLFSVLIELTYRCNLDCYFCYNDLGLRGRPLSFEQYQQLFEDLVELGTLNLVLSGGEPLAHPQFFQLGAMASNLGFMVRVKSNGHALGSRLANRLKNEVDPFLVEVSLHGACAETHDKQTRVKGSFERLLTNLEVMQGLGIRLKVNSTLTHWNEGEMDDMFALCHRMGLQLNVDPEVTPRDDGDQSPLSIAPSADGLRNLIRTQRHWAQKGAGQASATPAVPVKMLGAPRRTSAKHCGAGSSSLAIDPFGSVYPCVQYRRAAGNLHQHRIASIWRGENAVLEEIRKENRAVKALVLEQGISAYCPGAAYHQTGDAMNIPEGVRARQEIFDESRKERETGKEVES